MYRVVHLADIREPLSLTRRLALWRDAWLAAYSAEVQARRDEQHLHEADPRMLADVGLTHEDVARGALRARRRD